MNRDLWRVLAFGVIGAVLIFGTQYAPGFAPFAVLVYLILVVRFGLGKRLREQSAVDMAKEER